MKAPLESGLEYRRFDSVNLLKTIAILMVLMVHTGQLFKDCWLYPFTHIGQLGCQIFFVVSGFTLCMSSDKRKSSPQGFYLRRFMAIAPGYYFAILLFFIITICLQWLRLPHYWEQSYSIGGLLSNFLLIHGLVPDHINNIVPGGWFIGTIVLMYLTFPWLKRVLEGLFERNAMLGAMVPWFLGIIALVIWVFWDNFVTNTAVGNNSYLFFSIFTQFPCFVFGSTLYFSFRLGCNRTKPSIDFLISILFAIITLCLFYKGWKYSFAVVPLMASSCSTILLSALIKIEDEFKCKGLKNSLITSISSVSYEMYLLHTLFCYYIIWYARKAIRHIWGYDIFESSIIFLLAFLVVIIMSYYSGKALHSFLKRIKVTI